MTSPQGNEIYFQTGHMEDFFPAEFVCGEKMFWKGEEYKVMGADNKGNFFRLYYLQDQEFLHLIQEKRGRKIFCVYGEKSSLIRTRYV